MKKIILFCLLVIFYFNLNAQEIKIPQKAAGSHWHFGGNVGISVGNHNTGIYVAPSVAYMVNPQLEIGSTIAYQHNKYENHKSNIFSGGVFTNYHIIPELFARVHYEYYTGNRKNRDISDNFTENALWIGAGYQSFGRVRFQTGIMYNVLYDKDKSVFSNPWRPFAGVSIAF